MYISFKPYYLPTRQFVAAKVHLRTFMASRKTSRKISQASRLPEKIRLKGIFTYHLGCSAIFCRHEMFTIVSGWYMAIKTVAVCVVHNALPAFEIRLARCIFLH